MSDIAPLETAKKTLLGPTWTVWLDRTFGTLAGFILFGVMVVVVVDVIGRYAFSAPLQGGYEYIRIGMALIVFLALPVITAREENIEVEVFQVLIPRVLRHATRIIGAFIAVSTVSILTYVSFVRSVSFHKSGELFTLLDVPLYPVAYFIFVMWLVTLVITIAQLFRLFAAKTY